MMILSLTSGSLVLAGDPAIVLAGHPNDPAIARMREELRVLGYSVQVVASDAPLSILANDRGAAAAARARQDAVTLWVTGDEIEVRAQSPGEDPSLLALRAVELLRGKLAARSVDHTDGGSLDAAPIDAGSRDGAAPPPRDATPPPIGAASSAQPGTFPPAGPVGLSIAPAVLFGSGGVGPMPVVRAGVEYNPVPRIGVEVMSYLPTTAANAKAPEGMVSLRMLGLGGGIRGLFTDPSSRLTASLGLGLSAVLVLFSGVANPPFVGVEGTRWVAAPYLSASAGYRLHPRVALRLDLTGALFRPPPVVRIAGQDVASLGQPAAFASFGVEVRP